jgi:hypothetical protein
MDNNDNDERIMEEIIAGGANTFASYTDEEIICDRTAQNNSVLSPKPVHMAIKQ